MKTCTHKIGFLSLKACGNSAHVVCSTCNKPVCQHHSKMVNDTPLCLDCYAENISEDQAATEGGRTTVWRRRRIYRHIGYIPPTYGQISHYSENDYQDFDSREDMTIGDEDQLELADFQDS